MSTTTIVKSIFLNATPDVVWPFLVKKDKLSQWFHPAESDLVLGENYALIEKESLDGEPIIWGKVLEMDAPRRLVTTFNITRFNGADTTVTWLLNEAAGGTRVSLTHEGVAEVMGDAAMQMLQALDKGWDHHLQDLRKAV